VGNAFSAQFQTHLRKLCGFSGAGSSGEHYDLVGFNGIKNLLASLNYWQLGRVIEFERVHLLNANLPRPIPVVI